MLKQLGLSAILLLVLADFSVAQERPNPGDVSMPPVTDDPTGPYTATAVTSVPANWSSQMASRQAARLAEASVKKAQGPSELAFSKRPPIGALAAAILEWLAVYSELSVTRDVPRIEFISPCAIAAIHYERRPGAYQVEFMDCSPLPAHYELLSLYDESSRTIYLPDSWTGNTPAETSMIVRELVHYIQHFERIEYKCRQSAEKIAYAAQQKWLGLFGRSLQEDFDMSADLLEQATECTPLP